MKFFGGITSGPNKKDLGVVYPNEASSFFILIKFILLFLKKYFNQKILFSCKSGA